MVIRKHIELEIDERGFETRLDISRMLIPSLLELETQITNTEVLLDLTEKLMLALIVR